MVRTVVSLNPEDKAWLDRRAREERVPMTELVRRAIQRMRQEEEAPRLSDLLERSRGTWKGGDALDYQRAVRAVWAGQE